MSDMLQSREYRIKVTIGDNDISADVSRVQLISSISTPYLTVAIEVIIDPVDIINYTSSNKSIHLTITSLREIGIQGNMIDIELVLMRMDYAFSIKPQIHRTKQPDRTPITLIAVDKEGFQSITKLVNKIYFNKSIPEVIDDLVKVFVPKIRLVMDDYKINNKRFDQILIPPVTLYRAISYLGEHYGIYPNPYTVQFTLLKEIRIINLTHSLNRSHIFTIHQISSSTDEDIIINKPSDKYTYTATSITVNDRTIAEVAKSSKVINYIEKPHDALYKKISLNVADVISTYSPYYKNDHIDIDLIALDRQRFIIDHKYDEAIYSEIAGSLRSLISLTLSISRNLINLDNLLSCGSAVKFQTDIIEYVPISGKYLLESTNILFVKKLDWSASATLTLTRTNQKI